VRDPGVASVRPRPVVVELAHPPPLPSNRTFSFPCGLRAAAAANAPGRRNRWMGMGFRSSQPRRGRGERIYGTGAARVPGTLVDLVYGNMAHEPVLLKFVLGLSNG
jgi:hypothetical protein